MTTPHIDPERLTGGGVAGMPTLVRASLKISIAPSGCWDWTGGKTQGGYGQIVHCGRKRVAHRAIYELLRGPVADGLELDHLCRNRSCVNPAHLDPVTHAENLRRSSIAGRSPASHANSPRGARSYWGAKAHCKQGHEFSSENTYLRPGTSHRICRRCQRAAVRAYRTTHPRSAT